MPAVEVEQVLVVRTDKFHQCGYFQGFSDRPEVYLDSMLGDGNPEYLPRDLMETDPSFKQLIPYCIFQHVNSDGEIRVFQYRRGSGQGESRLHKKRSVGIGGHISTLDAQEESPYQIGMQRELNEEVIINTLYSQRLMGLINDDSNEVGRVHLGVVHLFTLAQPNVLPRETEIIEAGFRPVDELLDEIEDFETWSQICLRAIYT